MKKRIKIFFTDFWPVFNREDNFFLDVLKDDYDIEISGDKPDYLFYSVFGKRYQRYNCTRIFFTGENIRPNYKECDWSFSFDYSDNPRNYRLPLYAFFDDVNKLIAPKRPLDEIIAEKHKFCNFIYSNPNCKRRNIFFKKLSKYKKVESAGRLFRNTSERVIDKMAYIRDFKFTIAFENESYPGYTTEKIFEPMLADSIPIYWGNPLISRDFNTRSFVNWHDYGSDEATIERIIELDKDPELLRKYLSEPFFVNNELNTYVNLDNLKMRFAEIFSANIEPVAQHLPESYFNSPIVDLRSAYHGLSYWLNLNRKRLSGLSARKVKIKFDKIFGK
jgi:hypothetical protein